MTAPPSAQVSARFDHMADSPAAAAPYGRVAIEAESAAGGNIVAVADRGPPHDQCPRLVPQPHGRLKPLHSSQMHRVCAGVDRSGRASGESGDVLPGGWRSRCAPVARLRNAQPAWVTHRRRRPPRAGTRRPGSGHRLSCAAPRAQLVRRRPTRAGSRAPALVLARGQGQVGPAPWP